MDLLAKLSCLVLCIQEFSVWASENCNSGHLRRGSPYLSYSPAARWLCECTRTALFVEMDALVC